MNGQSINLGNGRVVLPLADHDKSLHNKGEGGILSTIICPYCPVVGDFDPSVLKDAKANQIPVCKFSTFHQKHSPKSGHQSCCPKFLKEGQGMANAPGKHILSIRIEWSQGSIMKRLT